MRQKPVPLLSHYRWMQIKRPNLRPVQFDFGGFSDAHLKEAKKRRFARDALKNFRLRQKKTDLRLD